MATQKLPEINAEGIKKLAEKFKTRKNYIQDPHGREFARQEYDIIPRRSQVMETHVVNHCQLNGGTNSTCYACRYTDDKSKIQCQRACNFFDKASFAERCMWETMGEYCWSTKAQDAKKAKGF